jgi:hypothetical protein
MITVAQIEPLRTASIDYKETESLKDDLAKMRRERQPLYLNVEEFEEILQWKLGQQIGRQRDRRSANTEETIKAVTGLALTITHADKEYQLELRVNILCALRGVGVPVASAVLALVFPEEYAVIDFRVWRQIFGEDQKTFFIQDYKRYMCKIHRLANELGWPVQEVDHAIWEYDRRNNKESSVEDWREGR